MALTKILNNLRIKKRNDKPNKRIAYYMQKLFTSYESQRLEMSKHKTVEQKAEDARFKMFLKYPKQDITMDHIKESFIMGYEAASEEIALLKTLLKGAEVSILLRDEKIEILKKQNEVMLEALDQFELLVYYCKEENCKIDRDGILELISFEHKKALAALEPKSEVTNDK